MPARALIFEDDEMLREVLVALCQQQGFEAIPFPDPGCCPLQGEACCSCGADVICSDAIICDLRMPVVNGLDFIDSQIAKGCQCRHIALVTGFCGARDLDRAAKLGCKLIFKPFDAIEITDWLDHVKRAIVLGRRLHNWQWPHHRASTWSPVANSA